MLPDFLIIGTKKGGTTSLHYYLSRHPDLFMSSPKELMFFSSRNWHRGRQWYERFFPDNGKKCGESTPDYTWYPTEPEVPKRIHSLIPHCKLIYIIRDPVERMVSNHAHRFGKWREVRSFAEVIDTPEYECYSDAGRYYFQIEQYLEYFPSSAIHVMTLEDLADDPRREVDRVCEFLDVDAQALPAECLEERLNRGEEKRARNAIGRLVYTGPVQKCATAILPWSVRVGIRRLVSWGGSPIENVRLAASERERLATRFRDDFRRLREFTGKGFENWKSIEYLQ